MHPADFGNSSAIKSIPIAHVEDAAEILCRLLNEIDYRGIFSAEFKLDERDGKYKMIEVNARSWWYVEFASRCGVNVCEMSYADALGEKVQTVGEYRVGNLQIYAKHDYVACRDSIKHDRLSVLTCLYQWLRSWRPLFVWDDPWPGILGLLKSLRRRLLQLLQRSN